MLRRLFIIILASLFIFEIFKLNLFTVQKVEIKKTLADCASETILREKSALLNKNIFLINEKNVQDNLKENFICIKNINFSKSLPNKIKMHVIGRTAIATAVAIKDWEASASSLIQSTATPSASQIADRYMIDDEGIIFGKNDNYSDLPEVEVIGVELMVAGSLPNDHLKKYLKILEELKSLKIDSKQTFILKDLLITNSLPKIAFNLENNIEIQIASLQLIVQKAKIDESTLVFIDLRFDKPIVKIAPKTN